MRGPFGPRRLLDLLAVAVELDENGPRLILVSGDLALPVVPGEAHVEVCASACDLMEGEPLVAVLDKDLGAQDFLVADFDHAIVAVDRVEAVGDGREGKLNLRGVDLVVAVRGAGVPA